MSLAPPKRAAHFLLIPELACSPPNEAIVSALLELGYEVDLFAPSEVFPMACYDEHVRAYPAEYGKRWLLKNAWSARWLQYDLFSGTSQDPLAVAGVLALLYRRPFFALDDEIKSGSYSGDAPEYWNRLCRWAMRRACFNIVNDQSRIDLLRDYGSLPAESEVLVYPGCFREPPAPSDRIALRKKWGIPEDVLAIGVSGGFNQTSGAEWLLAAFTADPSLYLVVQAPNIPSFLRLLLTHIQGAERMYLEPSRLSWQDAWASASVVDIGLAIYTNPAPQFQNMGVSSNRLCMFLAMGVPVIASRQSSFEFIERYDCGMLVENEEEFVVAIGRIAERLDEMKANALRCAREYIDAAGRYDNLKQRLAQIVTRSTSSA